MCVSTRVVKNDVNLMSFCSCRCQEGNQYDTKEEESLIRASRDQFSLSASSGSASLVPEG